MCKVSDPNPKKATIYGRLSFPVWTAVEAHERNAKGQYPSKDVASANPNFTLLLSKAQWEAFAKHCTEVFLPYCEQQYKNEGAKGKDALAPAEVKALIDGLTDIENQLYNSPVKPVHEKTAALAPEAVVAVKCIGPKGGDIVQKAIVRSENELRIPDPDILLWPAVVPIDASKFQMYPGAVVGATLSLYAYHNGKHPGFSAGVTTAVFRMDAEKFGGSVDVDEDAIFLD